MIRHVGVVGSGLMGAGIAEVCGRAVDSVVVYDASVAALAAGQKRIDGSLLRAVERGKQTVEQSEAIRSRIRFATEIDALAECDLVVEAVAEDEATKVSVFRQLDAVVESKSAILASNTSSIPIMKIAMATTRPEQVVGVHFFNPVPVLPLVEIVPSIVTSEDVETQVRSFVEDTLGKQVIRSQDRAGFIVNSLLIPYILAAIRLLESGFASADDIDSGMVLGCAHPMGPLHLADLIGLDTVKAIAEAMYHEFKEPLYSPAPLLLRMTDAGLLGRKSGHGFFPYATAAAPGRRA